MTKSRKKEQVLCTPAGLKPGYVEVTVCEPHSHNGQDKTPGDILALPAPIAALLVEAGVAKPL